MRYILFLLVLAACISKEPQLPDAKVAQLRTHFSELYKEFDSTATLDSFEFVRLDTITEKKRLLVVIGEIPDQMDVLNDQIKSRLDLTQSTIKVASLYRGLDQSLFEHYKGEAEDEHKKAVELKDEFHLLAKRMDSLQALYDVADSTSLSAYHAICSFQVRDKKQVVRRDTAYILMSKAKDIIDREAYFR